jgi:hypothetical protein
MDKILYEEMVLVAVAKADSERFQKMAEKRLVARHPQRKQDIQEDIKSIQQLGARTLQGYRLEQEKDILHHNWNKK